MPTLNQILNVVMPILVILILLFLIAVRVNKLHPGLFKRMWEWIKGKGENVKAATRGPKIVEFE